MALTPGLTSRNRPRSSRAPTWTPPPELGGDFDFEPVTESETSTDTSTEIDQDIDTELDQELGRELEQELESEQERETETGSVTCRTRNQRADGRDADAGLFDEDVFDTGIADVEDLENSGF